MPVKSCKCAGIESVFSISLLFPSQIPLLLHLSWANFPPAKISIRLLRERKKWGFTGAAHPALNSSNQFNFLLYHPFSIWYNFACVTWWNLKCIHSSIISSSSCIIFLWPKRTFSWLSQFSWSPCWSILWKGSSKLLYSSKLQRCCTLKNYMC